MESKIRVLTEGTINKIAAGEVIENPSSVVKELVENSLDAGASEITVEIHGGGRQLIRVTDNGCGMTADDALLCLERHATSKIKDVEDLQHLETMGFRGEAIPSIAAVSKFTLLTCPMETESAQGICLRVEGGHILDYSPASCPKGTKVEIKNLFYNVPVRKKFQRSPAYDNQETLKILSHLALGYPQIKFSLISNQEILLSTKKPTTEDFQIQFGERIKDVLGEDFYRQLIPFSGAKDQISIQGFIGLPAFTRQNRTGQYVFINRRSITSSLISFAVRDGFGPILDSKRYPVFLMHLSLPGSLVDVNVHPQKREVRLRNEQLLKELIIQSTEKALQKAPFSLSEPYVDRGEETSLPTFLTSRLQEDPAPVFRLSPCPSNYGIRADFKTLQTQDASFFTEEKPTPASNPQIFATLPGFLIIDSKSFPNGQGDGFCVVNQHHAHHRVLYEQLSKKTGDLLTYQSLLIPYSIETSPTETLSLKENLTALNQLGISIKEFGPNAFMIDALPSYFGNTNVEAFVENMLAALNLSESPQVFRREQTRLIALAASKAAVSKNKKLEPAEAQNLLKLLAQCENPFQCPLGKPIIIPITTQELNSRFKL